MVAMGSWFGSEVAMIGEDKSSEDLNLGLDEDSGCG